MKRVIAILVFCAAFFDGNTQELGVRFGDVIGGDVAIDAMFSTGEFNKIHADISFGGDGVGAVAVWDFIYRPLGEGFDWYFGAGPSLYLNDPIWLAATGELGILYDFGDNAPITISVDWRPTLSIIETTDLYFGFFGANIRYVFNRE